jgi:hypothetical protein
MPFTDIRGPLLTYSTRDQFLDSILPFSLQWVIIETGLTLAFGVNIEPTRDEHVFKSLYLLEEPEILIIDRPNSHPHPSYSP